jgi:enoyl-CoA hydratase/carnithine racemase
MHPNARHCGVLVASRFFAACSLQIDMVVAISQQEITVDFETLRVRQEHAVVFADIAAAPMNLLGTELVRDLVSLIQRAEADTTLHVLVFRSADRDYFISHVDVTRIDEYRRHAEKLTGEASIGLLFR